MQISSLKLHDLSHIPKCCWILTKEHIQKLSEFYYGGSGAAEYLDPIFGDGQKASPTENGFFEFVLDFYK